MESFTPNDYIALMKKQLDGGTLTDEENKILEIGAKKIEEQKLRDAPFHVSPAMLRDAEKADYRHRKILGDDY
ncbi:MAG: hypothetical protein AAB819_03165 [Patescibacteria group bacterium]